MATSLNRTAIVAALWLVANLSPSSRAAAIIDNFTVPANWGTPIAQGGHMSVGSGRMNYTSSSTLTTTGGAAIPRKAPPVLPITRDWSLAVDAHINPFTLTTLGQFSDVFLGVGKTGSWTNTHVMFEFCRGWFDSANNDHIGWNIQDDVRINGVDVPWADKVFNSWQLPYGDVSLRLDYSAANHTVAYYFDEDGAANGYNWVLEGIADISSGTFNLNMSASDTFTIVLVGSSGYQNVASGQAYLSNLRITLDQSPAVTTGNAIAITPASATLSGTVNPNGLATTAKFEYGLTTAYGNLVNVSLSPSNGVAAKAVSASIAGLLPATTYHYRLIATNSDGIALGTNATFTTMADMTRPTNTIISPTVSASALTNGLVTVQVRATDNVGVSSVEFYLNDQYFGRGFGWTSNLWTMDFALPVGTNVVQSVATDTSGNRSTTNSLRLAYVNRGTNANLITFEERKLQAYRPGPLWFEGIPYFEQDTKLLNAALAVPGLGTMPPNTWSNLLLTLSVEGTADFDEAFSFEGSLSKADVLTTNQAVFYYRDTNYPGANPAYIRQLTFSRVGDVLGVTLRMGNSTYIWGQQFPVADYDWNPGGGIQPISDQPMFTLSARDGDTTNTYADITRTLYLTGTNVQAWTAEPGFYLETHQESGAANFTGPTIAITAPVNGQTWRTPVFTEQGNVTSISPVEVWCQLNTNDWERVWNTGLNWSVAVNLTPGTNIIRAFAIDAEGYQSTTVTQKFVYVLDLTRPACTIVAPLASSKPLTNGLLAVQALATDNVAVSSVEFYVNGQYFGPGLGLGSNLWAMDFALPEGTNTVKAVAVDPSGNRSATNSLQMVYFNRQTNANVITFAEHALGIYYPGPPGIGGSIIQDTSLLNASVTVQGLQAMPVDRWSNLFLTLSFGEFSFARSLGEADVLTSNEAVFYYTDPNDMSANPAHIARLRFSRVGDVLGVALTTASPTYLDVSTSLLAGYYYAYGVWVSAQDQRPFTLLVQDGDTYDTYADIVRNIYYTGTPTVAFNSQGGYYVATLQMAGAADYTIPTNTITAPVNGQHWSNAVFTVKGTARDNVQVSNVWVQVNSAGWLLATTTNNWTNWTANVPLISGTNVVRAYAVDVSGNRSKTNAVTFLSSSAFELNLGFSSTHPLTSVGLELAIQVSAGVGYRVQASSNLTDWTTVTNSVGTGTTGLFRDFSATNYARRFYRVVVP